MKIGVCGHFGGGKVFLDGQTVKTKNVYEALCEAYGTENVLINDTYKIKARFIQVLFRTFVLFCRCDSVIMLPAHNGVQVFAPLFCILKAIFRKKIFYSVIGGWLPKKVSEKPLLRKSLIYFDGIFVETNTMKELLMTFGYDNVIIVPNFKNLSIVSEQQLSYDVSLPMKLCTFSRVMKQKGIEDAVNAVIRANNVLGCTAFSLDIYGQVDSNEIDWFDNLQSTFPLFVKYCGCVSSEKSVSVLQDYYALLFPTLFYTEGIPGTIIDAYSAGLPVISSRWESFPDIIEDGSTGIGYDFGNIDSLVEILLNIAHNPNLITDMKINCIEKANDFLPKNAIEIMKTHLNV